MMQGNQWELRNSCDWVVSKKETCLDRRGQNEMQGSMEPVTAAAQKWKHKNLSSTLTLTCPTNNLASSSRTVKLVDMVRSNSGSLSLTSVTTMLTVVVDVYTRQTKKRKRITSQYHCFPEFKALKLPCLLHIAPSFCHVSFSIRFLN